MKLRLSLALCGLLTGISLLTATSIGIAVSHEGARIARQALAVRLKDIALLTASRISPADLEAVAQSTAGPSSVSYQRVRAVLKQTLIRIQDLNAVYTWKVERDPRQKYGLTATYLVDIPSKKEGLLYQPGSAYQLKEDDTRALVRLIQTGEAITDGQLIEDKEGIWFSGYAPVVIDAPAGRALVVGLDIRAETVLAEEARVRGVLVFSAFVAVLFVVPIGIGLGYLMSRPLRVISAQMDGMSRLSNAEGNQVVLHDGWIVEVYRVFQSMLKLEKAIHAFARYLPREAVKLLLDQQVSSSLGGEICELTFMFTDVENFSRVAEVLPASAMLLVLNEYMGAISEPILQSGGTIDKYIGDSVMAFWGAPTPIADAASRACEAAIQIQERTHALNLAWAKRGLDIVFNTRIGVHTGSAIVGNLGSPDRINYTVVGDDVNFASRLEGINKNYATRILVSDATIYAVLAREKQPLFVSYLVDRVTAKGKNVPSLVYALLGRVGEVNPGDAAAAALRTRLMKLILAGDRQQAADWLARQGAVSPHHPFLADLRLTRPDPEPPEPTASG
ncbi:MAG: adenylate/guanylate cyclase domain-containing protein [Cyanobacteriota bacterium]|jgi:class 3 adenylate cyclase